MPDETLYQGGIDLRDGFGLTGHYGIYAKGATVELHSQHYVSNASGLASAFHAFTPGEARELAAALTAAAEAAEGSRLVSDGAVQG